MGFLLIRNVVLTMVAITLIMAVPASASAKPNELAYGSKWRVHVVNKMETGGVLFLHCKSKDDDLGEQNVSYNQEFSWGFKENYSATTLFWCYFSSSRGHAEFNVFWPEEDHSWLQFHCDFKDCIWTAKDDGIFLHNIPYDIDDYKHDWNSTTL